MLFYTNSAVPVALVLLSLNISFKACFYVWLGFVVAVVFLLCFNCSSAIHGSQEVADCNEATPHPSLVTGSAVMYKVVL